MTTRDQQRATREKEANMVVRAAIAILVPEVPKEHAVEVPSELKGTDFDGVMWRVEELASY